jgi:hypothetical protein
MPNDCQNKLIIKGTKEQLQQFLDTYISTRDSYLLDGDIEQYLDFNKIIPEPSSPEECDPECVIAPNEDRHLVFEDDRIWFDWYTWHIRYWGTKWNSYENKIFLTNDKLVIYFETAWDPCIPVTLKLFELHPELEFRHSYYEFGHQFGGILNKQELTKIHKVYLEDFAKKEGFI